MIGNTECEFPKCGRSVDALGLCKTHYDQYQNSQPLKPIRAKRGTMRDRPCSFKDCKYTVVANNLCKIHNAQLRKPGTLKPINYFRFVDTKNQIKECSDCGELKSFSSFREQKNGRGDVHSICMPCTKIRRHKYYIEKFGISIEAYRLMLESQGDACAICGARHPGGTGRWNVDHDHACCPSRKESCGKCVRGLLCTTCNTGLGHFRDDANLMAAAIDYLRKFRRAD